MARPIDEKIVAMKMDNSDFKQKAAETTGLFGKLRDALAKVPAVDMGKVTQSFGAIQGSANKVDMTGLASNIETIAGRFSNLGIVATTALANIANKAVNVGTTVLKSLTVDPLLDGFREYELKMGSIQTILANTQRDGTTLEDVKRNFTELNAYADQTIYSFAEMTKNIGLFTNAGLKLDESTSMIKGFSNAAAASGANAENAARAAYQLSQGLSTGYITTIDWISLTNAGMGNDNMKRDLMALGRAMGTLDKAAGTDQEVISNWKEELTERKWLTSDVMSAYLQSMAGDMDKATLMSKGLTEAQADLLIQNAKTGQDAATKIRTFTQMMSALKEGIGSGWAETWELIFGDFEEATERWSALGAVITGFFQRGSDARNKFVKGLADVGVFKLIFDVITNLGKSVLMIADAIGKGIGKAFKGLSKGVGGGLGTIVKAFSKLSAALVPNETTLKAITFIFQALFSVVRLVIDALIFLGNIFIKVLKIPFTIIKGIITGLTTVISFFGELVTKFIEAIKSGEALGSTMDWLKGVYSKISDVIDTVVDGLNLFGSAVAEAWNIIAKGDWTGKGPWAEDSAIVKKLFKIREAVFNFCSGVVEAWNIIAKGYFSGRGPWAEDSEIVKKLFVIREAVFNFCSGVVEAWNILAKGYFSGRGPWAEDSEIVEKLFKIREAVFNFCSGVVEAWNILAKGENTGRGPWDKDSEIVDKLFKIREAVFNFCSGVVEAWNILVKGVSTGRGPWDKDAEIVDSLFTIRKAVSDFVSGVVEAWDILAKGEWTGKGPWAEDSAIVKSLFKIRDAFKELGGYISAIDFSLLLAPIALIGKGFQVLGGHLSSLDFSGVLTSIANGFENVVGYIGDMNISLAPVANAFGNFFSMLGRGVDWVQEKFSNIGEAIKNALPSGSQLFAGGFIAGMIAIVGLAVKMAYDLYEVFTGWGKIGQGVTDVLDSVSGALNSFTASIYANALLTIAIALGILAASFWVLSKLNGTQIANGLYMIIGSLTALVGAMAIMSKYDITGTGMKAAIQIVALSIAFSILAGALKKVSDMSWTEITKGLVGLVGVMGTFALAVAVMSKFGGAKVGASALQMIGIALAMHILLSVVKKIAEVDTGDLVKGVSTLGIILLELGLFLKLAGGSKFGIGSTLGMLAVGQAIINITDAINEIAKIDTKNLKTGLVTIGLILTQIALFANLTSDKGLFTAGVGMLLIAGAITALIVPISILGNMNLETLAKGLGAMSIALFAIAGAVKLAGSGTMLAAGAGMLLIAIAMNALLIPISAFAVMGWGPMLLGMTGLALTLGIIGGAAFLLAPVIPLLATFGLGILALGAGMMLAGVGMGLFGTGLMTLATLTAGAITTIVAVLGTLILGLASLIPMAVEFVVKLCMQIITAIAEKVPEVVAVIARMLVSILETIARYIPDIVAAAVKLITNFLDALAENLPKIVESASNLMVAFVESLAAAVETNGPKFLDAIMKLMAEVTILMVQAGVAVIQALFGWIPGVKGATEEIGKTAEKTIRDAFGATKAGQDKGKDFANGLGGKSGDAKSAGSKVGTAGKDGADIANLKTIGSEKGQDFATALGNKVAAASSEGKSLAQGGKTGAGSISMNSTGSNFGSGFASGISSAYNSVVNAAKSLAQAASNKVKNWLDIHSPSRVTRGFGEYFGEGLALGIEDKVKRVGNSAKDLAVTAKDSLNQFLGGFELPEEDNELHFKAVIDYDNLDVNRFGNIAPMTVKPDTSLTNGLVAATKADLRQNGNNSPSVKANKSNDNPTVDSGTNRPIIIQSILDGRVLAETMVKDIVKLQNQNQISINRARGEY